MAFSEKLKEKCTLAPRIKVTDAIIASSVVTEVTKHSNWTNVLLKSHSVNLTVLKVHGMSSLKEVQGKVRFDNDYM